MNSANVSDPASQLPLPLASPEMLSRADFVVSAANAQAVACIDAWPDWPVATVALFGPPGSGKTHLAAAWRHASNAAVVPASRLACQGLPAHGALAIEDVDSASPTHARDRLLFAALESATRATPRLLTGILPPAEWPALLPDLRSRLAAVPALPLWAPDDRLLALLARKLFEERQLPVTDSLIHEMLNRLERSPAAVRDFVGNLDNVALAEARPVTLALVRRLLSNRNSVAQ